MNSRKRPTVPQPGALHMQRARALTLMLRILVLAPLPIIGLDLLRLIPQSTFIPITVEVVLITLLVSAVAAVGASWLVSSLAQSLRATEEALNRRDQANLLLEQQVAERTRELEEALAALQVSVKKYETLFRILPVGVIIVDEKGCYVEHNQIAYNVLSFGNPDNVAQQATDLPWRMFRPDGSVLPLDEYPSVRAIRERQPIAGLEIGIAQSAESNQLCWVSTNIAPLEPPHYGAVIVFSDITPYKRVEAELRASERFIQQITDTIPELVYVYDLDTGQVVYVNPAVEPILGYSPAAITAMGNTVLGQLAHPDDIDRVVQQLQQLVFLQETSAPLEIEYRMRRADGSSRWFLARNTIFARTDQGRPYQILGVNQDITARKLAELALEHQLTVQAAIARCSQTLLQPAPSPADQQERLAEALVALRPALQAEQLSLLQHVDDPQAGECVWVVAVAADHAGPGSPSQPLLQSLPWNKLRSDFVQTMRSGQPWTGATANLFEPAQPVAEALPSANANTVVCMPIFNKQAWWGLLLSTDAGCDRNWNTHKTLLLKTATEIIGTAIERWQTEANLSLQLHYAEALAHCSQALLRQGENADERRAILDSALTMLREMVGVSRLYIFQPPVEQPDELALRILADAQAPGLASYIEPVAEEIMDVPPEMLETLYVGRWFGGLVPGRFPNNPHFQQSLDKNTVQTMLMVPIMRGGKLWGVLSAFDRVKLRIWDAPTVQLLRTAAEMIATFQQNWEITQALATSEARLRALRDALPDLLFVIDDDGTLREYYAPRQNELLLPATVFLGRSIAEVMPANIAEMAGIAIKRLRASGGLELFEYSLAMSKGEQMFEARMVTINADELLVVVRDVTESRRVTEALLQAKEAAEAADRAKSTFLAHISHEIRTPLTAIIGMANLVRDTDLSLSQHEYITTIRTGAEILLTIIGNILDFSKIEAGQMEFVAQPFDLRACLKDALDLVTHEAMRKGLVLECAVDEQVPSSMTGDGGRLRQVCVNLLGNAVKFTERGSVTLRATSRPLDTTRHEISISISDSGIGIMPDQLEHIFDPFVQADSAITRRFGGTGLGLAISRQLIELMDGSITVASTPGMGSTFTFTLPLSIAEPELTALQANLPEHKRLDQGSLRVLLAEDNTINQEVLARLLESIGCKPDIVANGAEALAAVTRAIYNVVLMDIQMPELDGVAATQRIRALEGIKQPYIIALTASALRGDRERYLAAGMDDYLSKPVQSKDLYAVLNRSIRRGSLLSRASALAEPDSAAAIAPTQVAPLIDWSLLDQLFKAVGGPPAQATAMVLDLFHNTLTVQLAELIAAVDADDRPRIRLLAHKLRGGSRQLGAIRLAEHWLALETTTHSEGESLAAILGQARSTFDATLALLDERLRTPASNTEQQD